MSAIPQLLNQDQVFSYMAKVRQRQDKYKQYPFGRPGPGYSMNDPNCFPEGSGLKYDEKIIFGAPDSIPLSSLPNSGSLVSLNQQIQQQNAAVAAANGTTAATSSALGVGAIAYNYNVTPFTAGAVSKQVLNYNPRRQALLVQNQDAANVLFFNLGQAAGANNGILLAAGFGLLWEVKPPNNFVTVFSTAGVKGVAVEAM